MLNPCGHLSIAHILTPDVHVSIAVQVTGKACFAAALEPVDKEASERCAKERSWRFGYTKHVVKHVEKSAYSREDALKVCVCGRSIVRMCGFFVSASVARAVSLAMVPRQLWPGALVCFPLSTAGELSMIRWGLQG